MASKLKGKEWYEIMAPSFFGDFSIGQTMAMDPNRIVGRVIETSLAELSGDPNKYYLKFYFKIDAVNNKKASTIFIGHDCTRDFLARVVRRRSNRIDTNDVVQLQDAKIRIKTVSVTNRLISKTLETKIRKAISVVVIENVSKMKTEEFVREIIDNKLQMRIRKLMSKIYPLKQLEFRKTEVQQK
jgi:small subunit ribosomal protein S3Ae